MKKPLVTIITPSYNQGNFIKETIESVLNQTYENIQYIIVDGDSKDKSIEIINEYKGRIDTILVEKDSGQTNAINKGLKLAKGELVTWLCSDDLYEKTAIEDMVNIFIEHEMNIDVVYGDSFYIGIDSGIKYGIAKASQISYNTVIKLGEMFPQPSSLIKLSSLVEIGLLDENLNCAMDFDFIAKFVARGKKFIYLEKVLSYYRLHPASKTANYYTGIKFSLEKLKIINRYTNVFFTSAFRKRSIGILKCYMKILFKIKPKPIEEWSSWN